MGEKLLGATAIRGMLRAEVKRLGLRGAARSIGVQHSMLTRALDGTGTLGQKIPAHFGLEPVVLYEWKRPKPQQ